MLPSVYSFIDPLTDTVPWTPPAGLPGAFGTCAKTDIPLGAMWQHYDVNFVLNFGFVFTTAPVYADARFNAQGRP